jgi:putative transposase
MRSFRTRATLQLEILALRHQLQVLERTSRQRVRLTDADRLLWVWLSRVWDGWREAVVIVKPETGKADAWDDLAFLGTSAC